MPETREAELWSAPEQFAAVHPDAGKVWILPSVTDDGRRRVAVTDYNGTLQQVTYYGGRAISVEGPVPSGAREPIIAACKHVRAEYERTRPRPAPVLSLNRSGDDESWLLFVDGEQTGPVRIYVNEHVVFDGDPRGGVPA